ncbi:DUF1415 domain-containing protein [Limnohabitans sp. TS-CS-82]|uniref:DUF1415 domain-containing protein n=1 Tax=Limnohabitans sp. TS-CS-82 TaxID=2094193 RepID=UPI001F258934|nr:DUF1415 domain-containing protein [Limnohabitans sp. TS-CS-82]
MRDDDAMEVVRTAIEDTQTWLLQAVVGLNLCPFAKAVVVKDMVRYRVCLSTDPADWLALLRDELQHLAEADPDTLDTTLLIAPHLLPDFLDFNDFLADCDDVLMDLELDGVLQVADFHPRYQFGGTAEDDIENFTNRTPYPTLHLLREASLDKAVEAYPDASLIFERNIEVLNTLGHAGWDKLGITSRLHN